MMVNKKKCVLYHGMGRPDARKLDHRATEKNKSSILTKSIEKRDRVSDQEEERKRRAVS